MRTEQITIFQHHKKIILYGGEDVENIKARHLNLILKMMITHSLLLWLSTTGMA